MFDIVTVHYTLEDDLMSRLLTVSELYTLVLESSELNKRSGAYVQEKNHLVTPVVRDVQPPQHWRRSINATRGRVPLQFPVKPAGVAPAMAAAVAALAESCGMSDGQAWTEAAQLWMMQRQRDVEELASPTGQEFARRVQHTWSVIDEQMDAIRDIAEPTITALAE